MRRAQLAPCLVLLCSILVVGCSSSRSMARLDPVPDMPRLALSEALGPDLLMADPMPRLMADPEPEPVTKAARISSPRRQPATKGHVGIASFYHPSLNGNTTANGEIYDDQKLTAASRTLALGTKVRVTNLDNRKSVVVTVNDRGPYVGGRIIDLSRRAAKALDFVDEGITRVRVVPL